MRINTNLAALNAWRSMSSNQTNLQKSLGRLSSGYRINTAADDAAGLAVSEKMRSQIRGLSMATRNTQDAVSMVQTAEGGAGKIQDMLQRMRELAVQASSDTLQDEDRSKLQEEFSSLSAEIERTASSLTFNGRYLLNGASGSQVSVTSGTNVTARTTELKSVTFDPADPGFEASSQNITVNVLNVAQAQIINGGSAATDATDVGTAVPLDGTTKLSDLTIQVGDTLKFSQKAASTDSAKTDVTAVVTNDAMTVDDFLKGLNDQLAAKGLSARATISDGKIVVNSNVAGSWGNVDIVETFANGGSLGLDSAAADGIKSTSIGGTDVTLVGDQIDYSYVDGNGATQTGNILLNELNIVGNTITGKAGSRLEGVTLNVLNNGSSSITLSKNSLDFQVGANKGEQISTSFGNLTAKNLGIDTLAITDKTSINAALDQLDDAISTVSSERAKMGAMQNRLENTISNLQTQSENLTAAESRIRDVDMAQEMAVFTKFQVLSQASTAMLAQANQISQGILSLLR